MHPTQEQAAKWSQIETEMVPDKQTMRNTDLSDPKRVEAAKRILGFDSPPMVCAVTQPQGIDPEPLNLAALNIYKVQADAQQFLIQQGYYQDGFGMWQQ